MNTIFMNPNRTGGWGWAGAIGGILVVVSVLLPWLDLKEFGLFSGIQLFFEGLSYSDWKHQFLYIGIIFAWLSGITGLALLFASKFRSAMVFGMVAFFFCMSFLAMHFQAGFDSLLSIGPFVMMAGALMLSMGAYRLAKGDAFQTTRTLMQATGSPSGNDQDEVMPVGSFPDYSRQDLYGSTGASGQAAYDPNSQYARTNQNWPPKQP